MNTCKNLIDLNLIKLNMHFANKNEAIISAAKALVDENYVDKKYVESLFAREKISNTYLGNGVAIPHGMSNDRYLINASGISVVQIPNGVEWNSGEKAQLIFAISAKSDEHIEILKKITRLIRNKDKLNHLIHTNDPHDFLKTFALSKVININTKDITIKSSDFACSYELTLDYPNGLHARPASLWLETARKFNSDIQIRFINNIADCKNLVDLLNLGLRKNDKFTISTKGSDEKKALSALKKAIESISLEESIAAHREFEREKLFLIHKIWTPIDSHNKIKGIPVSPGLVIGNIHLLTQKNSSIPDIFSSYTDASNKLDQAFKLTQNDLNLLYLNTKMSIGESEAKIFKAQSDFLQDKELLIMICRYLIGGHGVEWAWHNAVQAIVDKMKSSSDEIIASRAADLIDVRSRVLKHINPTLNKDIILRELKDNSIIVSTELTPSETIELDHAKVKGIITVQGGSSSHSSILSRSLGIAAIVGAQDVFLFAHHGQTAILDGYTGHIYFNLSDQDIVSAKMWIDEKNLHDKLEANVLLKLPATTRDNHSIEIAANINDPSTIEKALAMGAESIGLMRTEFLFLDRSSQPTEEEQFNSYVSIIEKLNGLPIIKRLLDIGGDKKVSYLNLDIEKNPFLGMRGSRLLIKRKELLKTQLRALYNAAKKTDGLSIMFPMITTKEEILFLKEYSENIRKELDAPYVPLGIMVEVPSIALIANQIAKYVDFFSIGTNDLTQYTLAIDREHPLLSKQADIYHPSILQLIHKTVSAAKKHNKWVGVCGGLAGEPFGAALLIGLGVNEVSMNPNEINAVKSFIRRNNFYKFSSIAHQALNCESAEEVRLLEKEFL
ncbi:phosphoenolpyruvate--protein phosphotransferase [Fluviispira vulneris]|uniref:phosphoenolpyruvate--protein phosphotransferase n=1 Tax=Fluviispira vulneris TaxID=2763012 RepID=UPI001648D7A9|nr:phosphoenolpyruvate--protein phosphotransferase [Fluviispira vulneris]